MPQVATKRRNKPMSTDLRKELGRRLRALRKKRGYSQEEMADKCNLHWTYIGGLERGERNPTLTTLKRIADGLKVDLAPLLGRLEKEETPTLTEREKHQRLTVKWLQKGSDATVALAARLVRAIVQDDKKRR